MHFKLIDLSQWERREYFNYYLNDTPCSYSITANLDITSLLKAIKLQNIKLYPCIIYLLTSVVNKHEEFRTAFDEKGSLGVYDQMHPFYAVLPKGSELFANIWTEYSTSFAEFHANYLADVEKYGDKKEFIAKPNPPRNMIAISSIPWVSFTGFNLNIPKAMNYLLPIFTTGKFFEQNNATLLPISIQVHHAVCDGFHTARFMNDLQTLTNRFAESPS